MSASVPPQMPATPPPGAAADPSMEDILASIRRILSEDEQPAKPTDKAEASAPAPAVEDDVLTLDDSMLVAEPPADQRTEKEKAAAMIEALFATGESQDAAPVDAPPPIALEPAAPVDAPPPVAPEPAAAPLMEPAPASVTVVPPPFSDRLINAAAEAATAGSVSTLLRTLESGRQAASMAVYRGGPTLEDMVREEVRALLTAWLDANLPPMVERLVRAEIERVVSRSVG